MTSFILCIWIFLLASPWTTPFAAEQAPVSPAPQNQIQSPPAPETKAPATPETKAPAMPERKAPPGPETKAPAEPETKAPPAPRAAPSPRPPERRLSPPPVARGDVISLNFNRADLVEVIHVLAQHLRLTYTIDPEVKGTVTIHSSEPLKREDLLPIFHQILRINGAVAVKTGDFYRIAPIKEGKAIARPVRSGKEGSYALQVVPVRFFSVSEMKKLLTPFVSSGGEILDYPRGNFLIIVDLPSNIQKLMEIQELIDVNVFAGTRMEIYQPKVASAEELAAEMTKIMQSYASSAAQAEGFTAQFLPIPRINQLLVISYSEAAWTYAKRWLERIDVIAEGPGRRIFIYPVENGKAIDLADVLNLALGRPPVARRDTTRTLEDLHRGGPRGTGVPGTLGTMGTTRGGTGFGTGGTGLGTGGTGFGTQVPPLGAYAVAPTPPFEQPRPPVAPGAPPAPGAKPEAKPEEQLRIVPDPATNSLIIYGTAQEFQNIKNILKDLDQIPRQVLLDVLIAEVTLTDNLKFGVEYEIRSGASRTTIFNRQFGSTGAILSGILPAAPTSGLTAFPLGLSSVISPTAGDEIRAFINALLTDSRVKVLSSPSVLATDNRPARIQVGSEIPILTGQTSTFVSGQQPLTSNAIQYRNTGVILTIIPQVNSQGLVHLQVKQEVSDVGAAAFGATSSPSFTTRDAETTGVVQDGETLVIGGIITERTTRDRTGIPYLMDIPVLGRFFGTTTDGLNRTELIMLITPHVMRDVDEARGVTDQFKEKLSNVTREINRMGSGNYMTSQP